MKALTLMVVMVLAVGLVLAGTGKVEAKMAGKTHEVTTEIVSVDAKAHTLTIKGEDGKDMTVPVLEKAVASLAHVKAGEKVTLVCQDDEKGEHQGIIGIKPAKKAGA